MPEIGATLLFCVAVRSTRGATDAVLIPAYVVTWPACRSRDNSQCIYTSCI